MQFWIDLANSDFAQTFKDWESGFPTMESVHLIGLALFFGSILLLDMRVLGLARRLPLAGMKDLCLPLTWVGFALMLASGAMLFIAAADQYMRTWSFPLKMILIAAGGVNVLYFHFHSGQEGMHGSGQARMSRGAKLSAVLSLLIWVGAIVTGRWLGYERHP